MDDCTIAPVDLGVWYADPLSVGAATELLQLARIRQQAAYRQGQACFRACLDELVASFWLERPVALGFSTLTKDTNHDLERAMARLVYGQLLMSRRRPDALNHLQAGFALAWNILPPAAFFEVLRRHELLAYLPSLPDGGSPHTLSDLLAEAIVIRRLEIATGHITSLPRITRISQRLENDIER
ncbi:conserved hypothetical protein [Gammaproteobacteria bacterium]